MKQVMMIQRVGDRDKVVYSIKPYAFAILANEQSKCQKVIEIVYERVQDVSVSERSEWGGALNTDICPTISCSSWQNNCFLIEIEYEQQEADETPLR